MSLSQLAIAVGWSLLVLVDALALILLYWVCRNPASMKDLLSEAVTTQDLGDPTKTRTIYKASVSRLQFIIFTFVIALCLFLAVVHNVSVSTLPDQPFPDIPGSVLGLLGISGGSYIIGKGIQANQNTNTTAAVNSPTPSVTQ